MILNIVLVLRHIVYVCVFVNLMHRHRYKGVQTMVAAVREVSTCLLPATLGPGTTVRES